MQYEVVGGNLPVVKIALDAGDAVQCESGAMSWMDDGIKMQTSGGGVGKMLGRMFTGESLMLNTYTAERPGEIAFASSFPGSIIAVEVTPNTPVIAQKSAFLASYGNVEVSVHVQKKIGGGFFGGEGFLMQKYSGQRKIVDTGYLAMMDSTVELNIETVKGVKNVLFGGEGLFNTVLTGPGRIVLQTMPISGTAMELYKYMPHPSN